MKPDCHQSGSTGQLPAAAAEPKEKPNARKDGLASFAAVFFAFLASQHHNLHMLLLAVGIGAGMGFMTAFPIVRHVMLIMSLAMVAFMLFRIRDPRRPAAIRIANLVSVVLALGLTGWTVAQFGL